MSTYQKIKEMFVDEGLESAIHEARDLDGDVAYILAQALIESGPAVNALPHEFESQLIGRLADHPDPDIQTFVADAREQLDSPRLEPISRVFFDDDDERVTQSWIAHSDFVGGIAFGPEGNQFVSTSEDSEIRYFSLEDGALIKSVENFHAGRPINHVAVHADGRMATAGDDFVVKVTPFGSHEEGDARILRKHTNYVSRVAWCGDRVVSVSKDGNVALWDPAAETPLVRAEDAHGGWVYVLAVNPDGTRFATGSVNNKMVLWDGETGEVIKAFVGEDSSDVHYVMGDLYIGGTNESGVGHHRAPNAMVWSSDGSFLVSAESDIIVWNAVDDAFTEKFRLAGHPWGVKNMVLFDNDTKLASFGKTIRVWDLETQKEISCSQSPDDGEIRSAAISADESQIIAGDDKGRIWALDVDQLKAASDVLKHTSSVYPVTFSPSSRFVVSGSSDGSAIVFDLETGRGVSKLTGFGRMFVNTVGFRNDDTEVVACSDGEMLVFDPQSGELKEHIVGPDSIYSFTFQDVHASGKYAIGAAPIAHSSKWNFEDNTVEKFPEKFAQASSGKWVGEHGIVLNAYDEDQTNDDSACPATRWDCETLERTQTYYPTGGRSADGYFEYIADVDADPDLKWVFGASSQGRLYAWDYESGDRVFSTQAFDEYLGLVSYLGDGRIAAACSKAKEIAIYDVKTGDEVERYKLDVAFFRNVARSNDGQWMGAILEDHTAGIVDLNTGEIIATFSAPNEVWRAQISPDNRFMVVGTKDGYVLPLRIRIPD